MDSSRTYRHGKPFYRNNYMPSNSRQALEDRLHPPGVPNSSNSSWTFSNSHCDVPKPRKGRLCGICLIGAVLIVAMAVIAIGCLAFYIGGYTIEKRQLSEYQTKENVSAKRHFSSEQSASTQKPIIQFSTKITTTSANNQKIVTTESPQTKQIPEGAILGISETMKHLKNLKNNKKQEPTTTEIYEDYSTYAYDTEQPSQSTEVGDIEVGKSTIPFELNKISANYDVNSDNKNSVQNGHARPTRTDFNYTTATPSTTTTGQIKIETITKTVFTSPNFSPPQKDYSEEPWRPIIPSYRDSTRIRNPLKKDNIEEGFQHRHGSFVNAPMVENDSPITFSKESYEQNLKVTPEFTRNNGKFEFQSTNSRISEEIAMKYQDLVKDYRPGTSEGIAEIVVSADDVATGHPLKSSGVIVVSQVRTHSLPTSIKESDIKKENYPSDLEQTTPSVGGVENYVVTTTPGEFSSETPVSVFEANNTKEVVLTTSKPLKAPSTLKNSSVQNPFVDDSRSSSNFNLGLPDLPILRQFHHLDSLFKSFSLPTPASNLSRYTVPEQISNETAATRFPVRTKQTTIKSYKKSDTILQDFSTTVAAPKTEKQSIVRKPVAVRGEVEVVSTPIKHIPTGPTTEIPKLITLLPVRSNVNMMRPLRPRPKSNVNQTISVSSRKSKTDFQHRNHSYKDQSPPIKLAKEENKKLWLSHSSSDESKRIFMVSQEPNASTELLRPEFPANLTDLPLYNTIETLLNLEQRKRPENAGSRNTSELVKGIVRAVDNVAISTGDSPDVLVKVNQTLLNRTKEKKFWLEDGQQVPPWYEVNRAGVTVLRKILRKAPATHNIEASTLFPGCDNESMKCGNGSCISLSKKCDRFVDCPEAEDEEQCTCADHLRARGLGRKLCDGVVDCWDFSDEYNCSWCRHEFLCSNSKVCIKKSKVCDGKNDCPFGDDEKRCVTISPSMRDAETLEYHYNGYLMVQKNGVWAKLCVDNFDSVSIEAETGWRISDLGRAVCKALTFKDFEKVERMTSVPNEGRSAKSGVAEKYFELTYSREVIETWESRPRESGLRFREANCSSRQVMRVVCTDLECGLRPRATSQRSRKFSDNPLRTGSRRSRIVGGGNASPGSWPWQAALYREGEYQCGGTLVSENWLISAGHCFYHNRDAYWIARLGTLRTSLLLPSPYEQLRQISKIIIHPHYVDNGFINDISLLRMRDPVQFTDYVRPICLPRAEATIVDDTICTIVGWGQLSEVGWVFPDTLQEVQVPILSSVECRKRMNFLPLYKITDDMFCAGYDRGGRDACLGDSGGPLMCLESNGKWTLIGITSNGYGCARSNRPGVYTKVSKYLHWIHTQMTLYSELVMDNEETGQALRNDNEPTSAGETDQIPKIISQTSSSDKSAPGNGRHTCKGHRCPLGECLPKRRLCDGHIECSDGSDEKDCWSKLRFS